MTSGVKRAEPTTADYHEASFKRKLTKGKNYKAVPSFADYMLACRYEGEVDDLIATFVSEFPSATKSTIAKWKRTGEVYKAYLRRRGLIEDIVPESAWIKARREQLLAYIERQKNDPNRPIVPVGTKLFLPGRGQK